MKVRLFLLFLSISAYSFSQKRIKIEFNNKSTGDYDLIIKDILKYNGYDCFVDYHPEGYKKGHDLLIKYKTTSRKNYDELHKYSLAIYDSLGRELKVVHKTISYFNFGFSEYKKILEGLSELTNKKLKYNESNTFKKVKYFNIQFNVHKLDSSTYSIVAEGAGIRSLKDVEDAFLTKATEYLESFDYYFENGKYSYRAPGPGSYIPHKGNVVFGIIKGKSDIIKTNTKLTNPPSEFFTKFKENSN